MTDSNVITWNECRKVTSRLLNENDDSEFKRMIDTDKEIKYYTEIINGEYKVEYRGMQLLVCGSKEYHSSGQRKARKA